MKGKNMEKERKLNYEQTKNKALRFLEYRTHAEKELKDKLRRAGAEDDNIEKVMDFLREYNFVNDSDFALRYAKDLKNLKKFGKKRVKTELMKKGISAVLAQEALEELDWEEEDVLFPLIKKKLGGNFERKNTDKCIRYFLYKGYSYDDIKKTLDRVKSEETYGL